MSDVEPFELKSLDELQAMVAKARPLIRVGGELRLIELPHLTDQAFNWDPKALDEKVPDLELIGKVTTYHTYGAPVFFKPSVGECLSQIPEGTEADFFEVEYSGFSANRKYHIAVTTLYKAASHK